MVLFHPLHARLDKWSKTSDFLSDNMDSNPTLSAEERVISFGIAIFILYENLVRKKENKLLADYEWIVTVSIAGSRIYRVRS